MHSNNNDDASVSALFYFVLGIIFVGYIFIRILTPVAGGFTLAHNNLSDTIPPSATYQDSMGAMQVAINASPFIALFVLIVGYIVVTVRERGGSV